MDDDLRPGLVRPLDLRQRVPKVAVPVTDDGDDLGGRDAADYSHLDRPPAPPKSSNSGN